MLLKCNNYKYYRLLKGRLIIEFHTSANIMSILQLYLPLFLSLTDMTIKCLISLTYVIFTTKTLDKGKF